MLSPAAPRILPIDPDEQRRFDANDRAAEKAARDAELACGDAGPFPTASAGIPDFSVEDLPF